MGLFTRLLGAASVVITVVAVVTSGACARFPEDHPNAWRDQPSLQPMKGPQPSIEGEAPPPPESGNGPPQAQQQPPAPVGCHDPDPSVIATCLDPVGAIVVLPGDQAALVGERATGRILRVQQGKPPVEVARVPADPSGDGGLTGLALSPSYREDELVYAYVTTGSDNEVVRIAPGDRPKPVLSGIPKGASGNSGALFTDSTGGLLVATGNAGSPAAAGDPASLSGKVLRIDGFGKPAADNPQPGSPVISSGLASPGGLCGAPDGSAYWVTDRNAAQDALYTVKPGRPLGAPAWTWKDRPGVAGCVAAPNLVVVALANQSALYSMRPAAEGGFIGQPAKVLDHSRYGRLSTTALGTDGLVWLGTSNKAGGQPTSSDDRVIRIPPPTSGAAGRD